MEIELTRTSGVVAERVMPRPQIAWRHPEIVEVEPGETLIRDIPLPKNIGAEVARVDKARELAEHSDTARMPTVYYGVYAMPTEVARAQATNRKNASSSSRLAMGPNSDVFGL